MDIITWVTQVALAGVAAAVLSLIDPIPYVRDILHGLTRPHRGTWLIWSALGVTAFASQLADGARWSLALVGVQTAATTLILVLSIRFGMGGLGAADLCMIGRGYLYGLAAAGQAGAEHAIDLLTGQLRRTMQLLGVTSVAELRRHGDELVVPGDAGAAGIP